MLVHLLKLVWHRKRSNLLLMLEIFAAFLVVFAVVAPALRAWRQHREPLGYDHRDVWSIEISRTEAGRYTQWTDEEAERVGRLVRELATLEPITAVAVGSNRPFSGTSSVNGWKYEGRDVEAEMVFGSDDYRDVLDLDLVQGRWFEPADGALDWEPAVINVRLARGLFGDADPIDRSMVAEDATRDRRVIGVVRAFRRSGHFSEESPLFFRRLGERAEPGAEFQFLLVKVAEGTHAAFEEALTERLQAIAPQWSFVIKTLESDREEKLRDILLPTLLGATVAGFLLLMVVLGLTGVMWQNVTRRTREIGVRRAVGASKADIHRQVVAEVMITAAFGLLLGVLVVIQIPLVGPFLFLTYPVVLTALAIAVAFMVLLAGVCGLYPGWSATRIQPAEALHYE